MAKYELSDKQVASLIDALHVAAEIANINADNGEFDNDQEQYDDACAQLDGYQSVAQVFGRKL